jgi:ribosomal protein S18 acetylase RimI-like enzyme
MSPAALELIGRHLAFARATSPPEDVHALDVSELRAPDTTFFGIREGDELVCMGALKQLDEGHGEIKSMHTADGARRGGAARAMLDHLLAVARARGYRRVSLETGTMAAFAPARALYEGAGFVTCEPFAGYGPSANSLCMTLELGRGAPAWLDDLALDAGGPPWLAMGLARVPEAEWLVLDGERPAELAERRRLLAERHDEVFAALPGTEAAGAEVLGLVTAWLAARGHDEAPLDGVHPLEAAGRLVQEDLVLMVERDGDLHLDAACLCFPSHWRLADKLGRPTGTVHQPVPGYQDELAARVDRFLTRLRPGVVTARRNWSVHESPALFAPVPAPPVPGADLWLRSERQTLRRLADSGAVLFTIRVQQAPFVSLAHRPDVARRLAARLRAQPSAFTDYQGLGPRLPEVLAGLDATAGEFWRPGSSQLAGGTRQRRTP